MDASNPSKPAAAKRRTTVERTSDRELVVTRTFDAPPRLVFEAWTTPELFRRWWVPKSMGMTLLACEMDVRVGGGYRLEFRFGESGSMAFFGRYLDVTPHSRLVWTNDEGQDGPVTTVTFEECDRQTLLVFRELYPSKAALDAAGTGAADAMAETFGQLDELLAGTAPTVAPARS
ncbi:MAG: SRPBCC domain-containing protein [Proteobacteria bacterium]|nr:SRPBCC domain-containing protein [Pseudomonadota bacterium]